MAPSGDPNNVRIRPLPLLLLTVRRTDTWSIFITSGGMPKGRIAAGRRGGGIGTLTLLAHSVSFRFGSLVFVEASRPLVRGLRRHPRFDVLLAIATHSK